MHKQKKVEKYNMGIEEREKVESKIKP